MIKVIEDIKKIDRSVRVYEAQAVRAARRGDYEAVADALAAEHDELAELVAVLDAEKKRLKNAMRSISMMCDHAAELHSSGVDQ